MEVFQMTIGLGDVSAHGQTGLEQQPRLRGVRDLNPVELDPDMPRGLEDVDALVSI